MTALEALRINTEECKQHIENAISEINELTHIHANKTTLDTITDALIYAWNIAAEHSGKDEIHITSEEKTDVINVATNIGDCQRIATEVEEKFNTMNTTLESLLTRVETIENQLNNITFSIVDGNVRASWEDTTSASE